MNPTLGSFVCNLSSVLGAAVGGLGATGSTTPHTGSHLITSSGSHLVTSAAQQITVT